MGAWYTWNPWRKGESVTRGFDFPIDDLPTRFQRLPDHVVFVLRNNAGTTVLDVAANCYMHAAYSAADKMVALDFELTTAQTTALGVGTFFVDVKFVWHDESPAPDYLVQVLEGTMIQHQANPGA